ncbi:MAG TPA: inositol monophosphatase family protein [Alphaproteobacteria bacterium]|nr:inositol monophosphatase family protein [Alphaproteobacteria bacterium]
MSSAQDYLTPIQELAREAGALLMSYFGKVAIEYKGDVDLVTKADRASEELIVGRIRKLWPEHDLIGEEGSRRETGSEFRWHIDPLDGTTNFAHGFPIFCVSIGLEHKGERIVGVVYDPTRDEMFAAEKGSGARRNGRPIHVSRTARLAEALIGTGFPSHKRNKNPNIHFYHQITLRSHGVRRAGSAALDLCSVACGRYDAFWEFNLNSWDTAAGVLLVEEAGGRVSGFRGEPLAVTDREVLASNVVLHDELLREFQAILAGRVEGLPVVAEYFKLNS